MQKIISYCVVAIGIYLFIDENLLWGIIFFILGGAMLNGVEHGVWLSFHSSADDDDCGDGGGTDGGD